ncbi:MAG: ATP-binding cassette domain-containing protein, partial [Acidimicrobiales bacterium]
MATIITAKDVQKDWGGNLALKDVTVEVTGGITGLLGANGAGKTTLMGMLLGFHAPTAGSLTVMGLDPQRDGSELRANVGYSPEHLTLPDQMQAYEFVHHLARVRGIPKADARTRASDALFLVGLGEERNRALGTMGTGQKQ